MTQELTQEINIYSPDLYVDGPPHEVFEYLRKNDPVFYQEIPGEQGYWALTRYADVVYVSKNPQIFSSYEAGVVLEDLTEISLSHMRNMLLGMDPPRHVNWRRNVSPHFRSKVISNLEDQILNITTEILDNAEKMVDVDFVHDVSAFLPSNVMGEIMNIPPEDRPKIHRWAEMQAGGQDPEINPHQDPDAPSKASLDMVLYGVNHAKKYRTETKEDLTALILAAEVDGRPMTDEDFGSFFMQLVTAGNDTTRTMLSGGLLAFLQHPEQMQELRENEDLIPAAVEEVLRWANPLHYFRRTALEDVEMGGKQIKAGDKLGLIYTSTNRDEEIFEDPHSFNIHRSPNAHLSFGIAQHFCLGVHLARLEGKIFFRELLRRFKNIELTGEPRRTRSNLNNALKELPVKLEV